MSQSESPVAGSWVIGPGLDLPQISLVVLGGHGGGEQGQNWRQGRKAAFKESDTVFLQFLKKVLKKQKI